MESVFDLDKYLRASGATKPEIFDWSARQPKLDEDALFCLGYMMDIESHTIVYLKELLSTSVVREAEVTAFLACWVYEEFFHSQVLRRFLATQGVDVDDGHFARLRRPSAADRLTRPLTAIMSHLTRHFPAVHMTWGAVNELSTLTGYQLLIDRTHHPLLTTIMNRIIKDERRHFAFYYNQARRRLAPRAAQRLTSFLLRHFWAPVGSPVRGNADMRRLAAYLFPNERARVTLREHDATIARLPGLGWFNLGEKYCAPPAAPTTAAAPCPAFLSLSP